MNTWTPQSSWVYDKADGSGGLAAVDWTKGNVFAVQYQYLGFGNIRFSMEDRSTGAFVPVHDIKYPGLNTLPSLQFASLFGRLRPSTARPVPTYR